MEAGPASWLAGGDAPRRRAPRPIAPAAQGHSLPLARSARLRSGDVVELLERAKQPLQAVLGCFAVAFDHQLGAQRLFIGVGYAGEEGDFALKRLGVQALFITLNQFLQRTFYIDLAKPPMLAPDFVADFAIRRGCRRC